MPLVVASVGLSDNAFLSALNGCDLPLSMFRHGDHLRFAWLALHTHGFHESVNIVREGIRRFATHHGVAHIYHETVTTAWVHLLASHPEQSFGEFITEHEGQLNQFLLHRFWNPHVLDSPDARKYWVPPDKMPLPSRI